MKRTKNGATLTPKERETVELADHLCDEGIPRAVANAQALSVLPKPDPLFVLWLGGRGDE